jgi:antitoxin component HigA of HigAB toxin-antitoxin module
MTITQVTNDSEHKLAMAAVDRILDANCDPAKDSPEGIELLRLADMIEAYEKIHYRLD